MPRFLRSTCRTALRARELTRISSVDGRCASSASSPQRSRTALVPSQPELWCQRNNGKLRGAISLRRRNSTRSAHSLCFHVNTPRRPPGRKIFSAAAMPLRSWPNSSFTCMRNAWNVAFALFIAWYSYPRALMTMVANARVVFGQPAPPGARARQTASATRRAAWGSEMSPYSVRTRINSSRGARSKNSAAVSPEVRSKRRSSGPSSSGRKPLALSSSWGLEMPRSRKTPAGLTPSSPSTSAIVAKPPRWILNLLSSLASFLPTLMASGSKSNACSEPVGPNALRMARLCPARPKVPST
mmetsp:Transcript_47248/g.131940  ORF Transcript_47248/g.131940 Transcript_47248/m.131940 type:complete len:299 (+) Transcript_47248:192-1088(+)